MKAAKVSEVTGTKEEDAEADKLIAAASSHQLHSISTAMNTFLKSNPDDVVMLAEGPLKKKFVKNYVILQIRHTNSQKRFSSARSIDVGSATHIDTVPWNKHKIHKEMGPFKGDLFMGILPAKPCRLSGSMDPEAVEYDVPLNWSRFTHSDMNQLKLQGESEAKPDDMTLMNNVADLGAASSKDAAEAAVLVKEEVKTPEEVAAAEKAAQQVRINSLRDSPEQQLRYHQDLKTDVIKIKTKADLKKGESKYADMASRDALKVINALDYIIPVLEKLLQKKLVDAGMHKLLHGIDALAIMNADLQHWAERLGFNNSAPASSKRRKTVPNKDKDRDW
jgi:hypothetical protein